ncbi:MAG TPA: hypothetical protein QKA08_03610 [Candidatus Megaira endosymbiont of Nemacystus decipiens]|nr:hypothetical protein [Candidatus Megaera endosymbiont of Nemacystus decipiens]
MKNLYKNSYSLTKFYPFDDAGTAARKSMNLCDEIIAKAFDLKTGPFDLVKQITIHKDNPEALKKIRSDYKEEIFFYTNIATNFRKIANDLFCGSNSFSEEEKLATVNEIHLNTLAIIPDALHVKNKNTDDLKKLLEIAEVLYNNPFLSNEVRQIIFNLGKSIANKIGESEIQEEQYEGHEKPHDVALTPKGSEIVKYLNSLQLNDQMVEQVLLELVRDFQPGEIYEVFSTRTELRGKWIDFVSSAELPVREKRALYKLVDDLFGQGENILNLKENYKDILESASPMLNNVNFTNDLDKAKFLHLLSITNHETPKAQELTNGEINFINTKISNLLNSNLFCLSDQKGLSPESEIDLYKLMEDREAYLEKVSYAQNAGLLSHYFPEDRQESLIVPDDSNLGETFRPTWEAVLYSQIKGLSDFNTITYSIPGDIFPEIVSPVGSLDMMQIEN